MKEPAKLFLLQVFNYSILCFSYRALSQANILATVGTDLVYATLSFTIIRAVAGASDSIFSRAAYVLGSATGTFLGIQISLKVLGK